jgi:FkbM family methyltransferase
VQFIELPWGCQIVADIRETIGRSLWTTGIYDLAVTEILLRLTDPGSLALDIGANIGVMTGIMAAQGAEVWAFEPFPDTFRRLSENVALLRNRPGFGRCTAYELAASDVDGEAQMECPDGFCENNGIACISSLARMTSSTKTKGGVAVRTARLDSVLNERKVGVMKIDVEGHEPAVLHGATKALTEGRIDHIVFEEHNGPNSPACKFLLERDFTILKIGWNTTGPVLAPLSAPVHRVNEAPNYLATRVAAAALDRCSAPGWRCLRTPRARS